MFEPRLSPIACLVRQIALGGVLAVGSQLVMAQDAEVLSLKGKAEVRTSELAAWKPLNVKDKLAVGQYVRTGDASNMALLFKDQTQLRLSQNTTMQIKGIGGTGTPSFFSLTLGRAWTQSKTVPNGLQMQTPNAIAAIRGTDWDMQVDPDGTATLTVLSGEVELTNEFGKLLVAKNEQARVEKGKAPVKRLITNPRERVQWVTGYSPKPTRWLAPGRNATTAPQELGELGAIAGRIEAGETGPTLAELKRRVDTGGSAAAHLMLAEMYLWMGEYDTALTLLNQAKARFARDERAWALAARIHLLADRESEARNELKQALALNPDSTEAYVVLGDVERATGNAVAANAAYTAAVALNPQEGRGWFGLGAVASEREDVRPGRLNLEKALAVEADGIGYRGELATLETFANNFSAAEAHFKTALEQHPDDYVAHTGMGLLQLKRGQPEEALVSFLKASVMEPRYARVHVYTAIVYYQLDRRDRALQALDRAAELDPKDPVPHLMKSLIQTDLFQAVDALESARKALELLPNLKSVNQLMNNQKGSANLGGALANLGLEEWARNFAYESYTPFWAGSHLFLADRLNGSFNKNSELYQGFITDATVFGASNRFNTLAPRPGHYFQAGLKTESRDVKATQASMTANGFSNSHVPMAYFASAERTEYDSRDVTLTGTANNATLGFGMQPTHDVNLFLFGNSRKENDPTYSPNNDGLNTQVSSDRWRTDVGLNVKISPTNQLWLKVGAGDELNKISGPMNNRTSALSAALLSAYSRLFENRPFQSVSQVEGNFRVSSDEAQLRQTIGLSDRSQVSWGFESAYRQDTRDLASVTGFTVPGSTFTAPTSWRLDNPVKIDERSRDFYISGKFGVAEHFTLYADLGYQDYEKSQFIQVIAGKGAVGFPNGTQAVAPTTLKYSDAAFKPRLGMVYHFGDRQLLRAAYQQWRRPVSVSSLGSTDTAGVPLDDRLVAVGGDLQRTRAQLEWEFSPKTFAQTWVDYRKIENQSNFGGLLNIDQFLTDLERLRNRQIFNVANADLLEGTPSFGRGRVREFGMAVNQVVNRNWTGYLRYQYQNTRNTGNGFDGNMIPLVPKSLFALGATWTSSDRFYVSGQAVYRSQRWADEANTVRWDAGWAGTVRGYWESETKRWLLEGTVDNIGAKQGSTYYGVQASYRF